MRNILTRLFFSACLSLILSSCSQDVAQSPAQNLQVPDSLLSHSKEFDKKEVVTVTDGVYVAIGYGLANSIMIEGDDGIIIVDTMESEAEALEVKQAFEAISTKPIVAVIYTHNHVDHVAGGGVFADNDRVAIYGHDTLSYYLDRMANVIRPIIATRSARMFGSHLDDDALINAGIGPRLNMRNGSQLALARPNQTFSDRLTVTVAGVDLELVHAPGETADQIFVWLPQQKVLLPGDNIYRAFPNLYTIRGTAYRDVKQWVSSLDEMRALEPEYLVPSHTKPLEGRQHIQAVLADYRDAIQFVHDQTIYGINQGLTPDQLVETVRLPAHLAQSPFLKEHYGTVAWSVRAIFEGYLGWFDGNPSRLLPLSETVRSEHMARLAGGIDALHAQAELALAQSEYQWALELTDHLMLLKPDDESIPLVRKQALIHLGQSQENPNARHYYLTAALELGGGLKPGIEPLVNLEYIHKIPMEVIFSSMAVNLDASEVLNLDQKVNFYFPDTNEAYSIHLYRGVARMSQQTLSKADYSITIDSKIWKEIVAKVRNPVVAFAQGDVQIVGGVLGAVTFIQLFQPADS